LNVSIARWFLFLELTMPIENVWYKQGRVIFERAYGTLSADDVHNSNTSVIAMIREGQSPVHIVIDARTVEQAPFNLRSLQEAVTAFREPGVGWILVIANNAVFRFWASAISQLSKAKFRSVQTPDEAIQILMHLDPSVGELLPVEIRA
jgi:hypothetical protein